MPIYDDMEYDDIDDETEEATPDVSEAPNASPDLESKPACDLDPLAAASEVLERIKSGAFLTVQAGDYANTMTIGWAEIGYMWARPVLTVAVRDSRWTYQVIEKARDFTVTIPRGDMKKALAFCGSRTGAKLNKFEACGLELGEPFRTLSPTIWCDAVHYECRIVYKNAIDPKNMHQSLKSIYPLKDYHTLYYGEILACYET